MSSYGSMEAGAVPGARDRARGPVTLYSFGIDNSRSRALNHTERLDEIAKYDEEMHAAIGKVQERYAYQMLGLMRRLLAPFNLSRHPIRISAAMGTSNLMAGDRYVSDLSGRGTPVVDQLQELDQLLEGGWHWAYHLDGQVISAPPPDQRESPLALAVINDGESYQQRLLIARTGNDLNRMFALVAKQAAIDKRLFGTHYSHQQVRQAAVEVIDYMEQHVKEIDQ